MALTEGVAGRVVYKRYAGGTITPGIDPTPSTAPGASGGQVLRRVASTLNLAKDTYQSGEVRSDRQIADFRHGVRRAQGNVSGELSPGTYFDFYEAVMRGTRELALVATETDMTSVAADATARTFTCGGSTWAAEGFRVGDTVRFADLSAASNNAKNFTIIGLAGTVATVFPAPTTMSADTAFTVTRVGGKIIAPSTGIVNRLFAIEAYHEDIDVARLFTELRAGSFTVGLPASGMATTDIGFMGRNMHLFDGVNAPFFTSPAAALTTGICAAVSGALVVGGTQSAVVTGLDISVDLSPSSDPVLGSNLVPEIFLGRFNCTGTVTAFFENVDMLNYFLNESEISLIVRADSTSDANSDFVGVHLPRVKLGGADVQMQGEGGQTLSIPFQALLRAPATGFDSTTMVMQDSTIVA